MDCAPPARAAVEAVIDGDGAGGGRCEGIVNVERVPCSRSSAKIRCLIYNLSENET